MKSQNKSLSTAYFALFCYVAVSQKSSITFHFLDVSATIFWILTLLLSLIRHVLFCRAYSSNLGPSQSHGFNIIKYVWNNRASLNTSQMCIDTLLNHPDTKRLRVLYPNLSGEFLSREFRLILSAVRQFARNPTGPKDLEMPVITPDNIVYVDPVSRVQSKTITYGYLTDFTIFMLNDRNMIRMYDNHKKVLDMIGIKPICGIFSYAKLPTHYKFLLGMTGTLKCMTQDQVSSYMYICVFIHLCFRKPIKFSCLHCNICMYSTCCMY